MFGSRYSPTLLIVFNLNIMNSRELREKFIKFFEKRDHTVIPSSSLSPENDPTVLFITAGMQPLVPFLLGESHSGGKKLTSIQKCIRTGDIDEVGDDFHLTFFEMLGFWSLGSYWKKEAITLTYEFLTSELGINPNKLAISCFKGENEIPQDHESADIWHSLGIPFERIIFLGTKDNFWGPAGEKGPCGPDTEMFVWTGKDEAPEKFDPENDKWMEIGNDVFMEYEKKFKNQNSSVSAGASVSAGTSPDGKIKNMEEYYFEPLKQKNVDFGAGFERITSYLEGKSNVYETELFMPIILKIEEKSGKKYQENRKEFRIISDHIKAAVFAIEDGVIPSNKEAGYIVRRLLRRSIVKAMRLGIVQNFTSTIAEVIFKIYEGIYFNSEVEKQKIIDQLETEETKFRKTLKDGLKLLNSIKEIDGKTLFNLFQTFGIPLEISVENLKESGKEVSDGAIKQFNNFLIEHQELSRTASAGMFKGGLSDASEETTRLHTSAHLLLESLRRVLGDQVTQRGSNITPERLRFDFSHSEKLTPEQLKQVEDLVNEQIEKDLPIAMEEMTLEKAKGMGATGVFESKYGNIVKVYSIGEFSKEICGGPHVNRTGELGKFKITKEESSSAGVRRIKAVLSKY